MAKVSKKDFQDLGGFGDLGDFVDNSSFPSLDTSSDAFINGGFDANGQDGFGLTPDDYAQLGQFNASLGDTTDPGASGGGFTLPSWLLSALGIAAPVAGGIINHNTAQQATQNAMNQINNTNQQITSILGGARAGYAPYMQAGQAALTGLMNMPKSNLVGMFKPIGSGKGLSLSTIAKG